MIHALSRLWREPLLHFLLIGAALFLYYHFVAEDSDRAPANRVHVTSGEVAQLAANFERSRRRRPTPEELDAMVESLVREEIFYREAMAMGLDQDDPMVRRRMRMKLEFMLEDLSGQDASDEALGEFLRQNPDRFREDAKVSFQQVFLDPVQRRVRVSLEVACVLQHNGHDLIRPVRCRCDQHRLVLCRDGSTRFLCTGGYGRSRLSLPI